MSFLSAALTSKPPNKMYPVSGLCLVPCVFQGLPSMSDGSSAPSPHGEHWQLFDRLCHAGSFLAAGWPRGISLPRGQFAVQPRAQGPPALLSPSLLSGALSCTLQLPPPRPETSVACPRPSRTASRSCLRAVSGAIAGLTSGFSSLQNHNYLLLTVSYLKTEVHIFCWVFCLFLQGGQFSRQLILPVEEATWAWVFVI